MAEAGSMTRSVDPMKATAEDSSIVHRCGKLPLILSAPHTVHLQRDGHPDHKPEDLTGFLAEVLAGDLSASSITWSSQEVSRSSRTSKPNPANRDPNFLRAEELDANPWHTALCTLTGRWQPWGCLLVDLHGRRDHVVGVNDESVDRSDCDCGLGAMFGAPPSVASRLEQALSEHLSTALASTAFELNMRPRLTGHASEPDRRTVSQQAVACGAAAVQLELSLRLRHALYKDDALRSAFAVALGAAARVIATDAVCPPLAHPTGGGPGLTPGGGDGDGDGVVAVAEDVGLASPRSRSTCEPLAALFVYAHPRELLGLQGVSSWPARLPDHGRVFGACDHPVSWGGGLCSLAFLEEESVHGRVYMLSEEQLARADRAAAEGEATQRGAPAPLRTMHTRSRRRVRRRIDRSRRHTFAGLCRPLLAFAALRCPSLSRPACALPSCAQSASASTCSLASWPTEIGGDRWTSTPPASTAGVRPRCGCTPWRTWRGPSSPPPPSALRSRA